MTGWYAVSVTPGHGCGSVVHEVVAWLSDDHGAAALVRLGDRSPAAFVVLPLVPTGLLGLLGIQTATTAPPVWWWGLIDHDRLTTAEKRDIAQWRKEQPLPPPACTSASTGRYVISTDVGATA